MVSNGLGVNEASSSGSTALSWALKRGETPLVALLRSCGATEALSKRKSLPNNPVPQDPAGRELVWAGATASELQRESKALLALQRPDGGWAPLPGLESDSWATGHTLAALDEAGALACSHPAYQRGIDFLLRTQFEDGFWWVKSRTWPFQPHFDSGFPHGKDQWISAGGTAWAAIALLNALEPAPRREAFPIWKCRRWAIGANFRP